MEKTLNKILNKNKRIIFIVLVIIITASLRIPFLLDDISFNNDAVIYSRNIEKSFFEGTYDVHVPGYVSYIYLGRFLYYFIQNTVVIQHIINLILVILISLFFFKLTELMDFDDISSFIFTIMFSFNNILLLGSITGGNRLFLTLCSILLIYISYSILRYDKKENILWFAVFFALFIGFRQDISIYFIPLYIYLIFKIKNIKYILSSLCIFTAICLSWFVPLMMEYGGIGSYLERLSEQSSVYNTSLIFSGFTLSPILNMLRVFIYMINSFLFIFPILIFSIIKKEVNISKDFLMILIFSFFPALIFQMIVHNGNFVHLAAFMTPLFIFMIYNFKLISKKRIIISVVVISLLLFQFFGVRMLKGDSVATKAANILWLQYSYDGAKGADTLRLKMLKEEN